MDGLISYLCSTFSGFHFFFVGVVSRLVGAVCTVILWNKDSTYFWNQKKFFQLLKGKTAPNVFPKGIVSAYRISSSVFISVTTLRTVRPALVCPS